MYTPGQFYPINYTYYHDEVVVQQLNKLYEKVNYLIDYLGLEYQDKCTEQLPKWVKKKKPRRLTKDK